MYRLLTFIVLITLPFFLIQIDVRMSYVISIFAFLLLPIFVKNLIEDLRSRNPITIFFLLFLLASAISTIFSIDQQRSSVQLMLYISYFVIFTSIRSIFPNQKSRELLITCLLSLITLLSLINLYNTLIRHYVNWESMGVSFMWIYYGHNHLSALLLFAIPISFYLLIKYWKTKTLNIFLLVTSYLLLFSLFLTFGIVSIISFLSASLIALFFLKEIIITKKLIATGLVLCILVASVIGVFYFDRMLKKDVRMQKNPATWSRAHISYWKDSVDNGLKKPFAGSGLDTFRMVSSQSQRPGLKSFYAHNFFMQMLSDAGILGFIASIGLIGSVLWQGYRKIRNSAFLLVLFVGLLASTINTVVDFDWQLPYVFLIFWLITALQQANSHGKLST